MDQVVSVILAGGEGTRLFPLTRCRCKPDRPVCGAISADRYSDLQFDQLENSKHFRSHPTFQHIAPSTYIIDLSPHPFSFA